MSRTKRPESMKVKALSRSRKDRPWYLDPKHIRQKTRHSWTDIERKGIYFLRIAGVPVKEVIRIMKLDVGKIPVNNIYQQQVRLRKGKCSCGKKLTQKEIEQQKNNIFIKCTACLEKNSIFKKELRRKYLEQGLCGICGQNKVLPGHTTCKLCLSADYRRSYVKGLCGKCHVNPINKKRSKALCNSCLDLNKRHVYGLRHGNKKHAVRHHANCS